MVKRYIAKCQLRIIVDGIGYSFNTTSGGKSELVTVDERVQNAIERHPDYGHSFFLDTTLMAEQKAREEAAEAKAREIQEKKDALEKMRIDKMIEKTAPVNKTGDEEEIKQNVPIQEVEVTDDGFTVVEAASITDARNYLFQQFGIAKSRMIKRNDLFDRARECSIKFIGKDF